ncbi:capsule assembly Wzi family protein [Dyadobacter jiangsuensis]
MISSKHSVIYAATFAALCNLCSAAPNAEPILKNDILDQVVSHRHHHKFVGDSLLTSSISDTLPEGRQRITGRVELGAYSMGRHIPFWFRTNTNGNIPLNYNSGYLSANIQKPYKHPLNKTLFDWAVGLDVRSNAGTQLNLRLTEAYLKGRFGVFQLSAGRTKDITGLVDSTLSSGAFSISGNSLGIPKIEISTPEFVTIPRTYKLIAAKIGIAHGWFGRTPLMAYTQRVASANSYYHQLQIYGRFGKPTWKLKFYGGINHQVMWGDEKKIFGNDYELNGLQTYWHMLIGREYGNSSVPTSKIGEQLGSVDQLIELRLSSVLIRFYHQFFYTTGGLWYLSNIKDGLFGITLQNSNESHSGFRWQKLLIEFLNSKSQGGEIDARITPSGAESYYHSMYRYGWTYHQENLGNNFFTNRNYAKPSLVMRDNAYIINNRVNLFHLGFAGSIGKLLLSSKISWSRNYGTYATSSIGVSVTHNTDQPTVWVNGRKRIIFPGPYFERVNQLSAMLLLQMPIKNNFWVSSSLAIDNGGLLPRAYGLQMSLSRRIL